jgi:hypothetical protein
LAEKRGELPILFLRFMGFARGFKAGIDADLSILYVRFRNRAGGWTRSCVVLSILYMRFFM